MSNKYAPHLDRDQIERILQEEETGVLCLADGADPYAVPISYAWIDGAIVIHCAQQGRKLDILRRNPRIAFVVYRHPDRIAPHAEGQCSYRFESVCVFGRARIVEEVSERLRWLQRFQQHFFDRLGLATESNPVTRNAAEGCACVVISVESMTGRRKESGDSK